MKKNKIRFPVSATKASADRPGSRSRFYGLWTIDYGRDKGFTLIELMLVVIILGILVAMVVPRLVGRGEQAREQAAYADINSNIALALDLYELDNGRYPENLEDLSKDPGESRASNWNGPYLKRRPKDPWGKEYNYRVPGQHSNDYDLYSFGGDGVEGGEDDISNWDENELE